MNYEETVSEIKNDFLSRQKQRRPYELAWQLNINFFMGNQYCAVSSRGIEQEDKYFFWQEKQVYNHIAPVVDTRLARLNRVRPKPTVRPFSAEEKDVESAKMSTKILACCFDKLDISELITSASAWSEVCGTSFYKVSWKDTLCLKHNGKEYSKGDVAVTVCPPFEIYPDSNVASSLKDCASVIHARVYPVEEIKSIWGEEVKGEEVTVFAIDNTTGVGGLGYNSCVPSVTQETKKNVAVVLERYTKPTDDNPFGKLEIVAGDKLLYVGDMPYVLGANGEREFPFVRQISLLQTGCFWGASIVERLIPVQRAYNAVKNRKHEFLNRLSMGILEVEDGSVDTDNLEEEGLSPGKILIYRQGSNKPQLMSTGSVPNDFTYEEEQLLNEFRVISGVSEFASTSYASNVSSGTALQLLVEQDDVRMQSTIDSVKYAVKLLSKYILRLYKQCAENTHLCKIASNDGDVEVFYFVNSDISSDDVIFETENEVTNSLASRRSMVMELVRSGILLNEDGRMSKYQKSKVLTMLGFGNWEDAQSLTALHVKKAQKENLAIDKAEVIAVDDHKLHIEEHTRFVISGEAETRKATSKVLEHIKQHKLFLEMNANAEVQES